MEVLIVCKLSMTVFKVGITEAIVAVAAAAAGVPAKEFDELGNDDGRGRQGVHEVVRR